jgi:hypothetical protein
MRTHSIASSALSSGTCLHRAERIFLLLTHKCTSITITCHQLSRSQLRAELHPQSGVCRSLDTLPVGCADCRGGCGQRHSTRRTDTSNTQSQILSGGFHDSAAACSTRSQSLACRCAQWNPITLHQLFFMPSHRSEPQRPRDIVNVATIHGQRGPTWHC